MGAPGENEMNSQLMLTKPLFARGWKPTKLPGNCQNTSLAWAVEPEGGGLSMESSWLWRVLAPHYRPLDDIGRGFNVLGEGGLLCAVIAW